MPRVAFAYDHVYPESVGGAQRYYWALTRELARRMPVSYLTPKRWEGPSEIERDGVQLVGVGRREGVGGFGPALAAHLARHAGRYDVVHCACFPVGVAALARVAIAGRQTPLVVDWHEVLPRSSWRRIRGRAGDVRWLVQRLAVRHADVAITFSHLHERRLREEGRAGPIELIPEFLPGAAPPREDTARPREPLVVFLGRLNDYKRANLVAPVLAELRRDDPAWRAVVIGDGPAREQVAESARAAGVGDAFDMPGFLVWDEVAATLGRAAALLLPTEREGFGLVVLEAAAHGLPTVLVAASDNAATELIEAGVNGVVCPTADPGALAGAVRSLWDDGTPSRARSWYEKVSATYSVGAAADAHERLYERHLRAGV